ncbi:MAG: hydroxymethylbilane synthase [Verrucomicrobiales bacterium]|nr:hydroxymethylbilane synthase [Verrucomicrobiales bacterium]|tara:strand:- start:7539 stop:8504 length:966 start_codon:yes stop_codon:yes gene_type:complete
MSDQSPVIIGTRGSALALVQANMILAQCRAAFPEQTFEIQIIKTTGDKLKTASLANPDKSLPKGLFTKELEVALLDGRADLAVHSLKDLPTELPDGLLLGATPPREDVRDVLIYRSESSAIGGLKPAIQIGELPEGATIASSSTRRQSQLREQRPDLKLVEIRGNVPTRLRKISEQAELHGTLLAAAGLKRLGYTIDEDGTLNGKEVPDGLLAVCLSEQEMLPAVGQAAIGIETRKDDERIGTICEKLNHEDTLQAVTAERAFLRAFGGGCATPVAAHARVDGTVISMEVVSYVSDGPRRASGSGDSAEELGKQLAAEVLS